MKKIMLVVAACALTCLVGCGDGKKPADQKPADQKQKTEQKTDGKTDGKTAEKTPATEKAPAK